VRLPRPSRAQLALGLALLATLPLANPYIRGEGHGYYAYLPSVALDRDLHFENEYRRGDPDFVTSNFRRADGHLWPPMETPTGRVRNQWPSGAALLWAPAFLQAHAAVLVARSLGAAVAADGYALPYRMACAAATAAYAALALLLAARAAERIAGRSAGLAAAVGVWLASSLPVYMYFLPFYGHAPGAFATGVFVWWWLERRPMARAWEWAVWGASAGLVATVDHFAIPVLVIAAAEWTLRAVSTLRDPERRAALPDVVARMAAFLAAAVAVALPDLVARSLLHGSPWDGGRLTRFFWSEPRLWETGFSTQHGLFLWTPVALAAVAGLVLLAVRRPATGAPLLAAFGLVYYAVASYELWHGSSSFGNRYFVASSPLFVIGLAELLRAVHGLVSRPAPPLRWAVLGAGLAVLAAWNAGLLFQWGSGMIPRQGPVEPAVVARNQAAVPRRVTSFALRYLRSREQAVQPR
jgi:hypothetical protein